MKENYTSKWYLLIELSKKDVHIWIILRHIEIPEFWVTQFVFLSQFHGGGVHAMLKTPGKNENEMKKMQKWTDFRILFNLFEVRGSSCSILPLFCLNTIMMYRWMPVSFPGPLPTNSVISSPCSMKYSGIFITSQCRISPIDWLVRDGASGSIITNVYSAPISASHVTSGRSLTWVGVNSLPKSTATPLGYVTWIASNSIYSSGIFLTVIKTLT